MKWAKQIESKLDSKTSLFQWSILIYSFLKDSNIILQSLKKHVWSINYTPSVMLGKKLNAILDGKNRKTFCLCFFKLCLRGGNWQFKVKTIKIPADTLTSFCFAFRISNSPQWIEISTNTDSSIVIIDWFHDFHSDLKTTTLIPTEYWWAELDEASQAPLR